MRTVSLGLADLTDYMRSNHQSFDTDSLLAYNNSIYVHELASQGGLGFLDFFVTVLDNADNINRRRRHVKQRNEIEKVYALSKIEANAMAAICQYLAGNLLIYTV